MSDTPDDQLRRTFDALTERLHAAVSDQVRLAVDQAVASVETARQAAVATAARDAAAAAERETTTRLNEAFASRETAIREQTRAEFFEAGLRQARAEARTAQEQRDAEMQSKVDAAVRAAAEATASAEAARHAVATAEAEAGARAAALASATESYRMSADRLLRSVRALDRATSLSQTLDALAAAARREADRTVLFLVRGEALRAWSHAGFESIAANPVFEMPLSDAGLVADASRTVTSQRVGADKERRPAFARPTAAGAFAAVPLTMNGEVIAVLCGEQPGAADDGETLASTLEVLARHAARVLESLTAVRLAQLGAQPAIVREPGAPKPLGEGGPPPQ